MMTISKTSLLSLLAAAGTTSTSDAFCPSRLVVVNRGVVVHHQPSRTTTPTQWKAATIDETTTTSSSTTTTNGSTTSDELTTWECNDEAECVEVPACDEEQCRTSLDVRIHGEWYDLTGPCNIDYHYVFVCLNDSFAHLTCYLLELCNTHKYYHNHNHIRMAKGSSSRRPLD